MSFFMATEKIFIIKIPTNCVEISISWVFYCDLVIFSTYRMVEIV